MIPLPVVQCPSFLDFRNPWEKVMERRVSDLKNLAHKGWKVAAQKKFVFFGEFCLTRRIFLVSVLKSASDGRFFVSHMRDFFVWQIGFEFTPIIGIFSDLWQSLAIFFANVWQSLMIFGDLWQSVAILGNLGQTLASSAILSNCPQSSAIFSDFWQSLAIFGDLPKSSGMLRNFWWSLANFGNLWRSLAIFGNL